MRLLPRQLRPYVLVASGILALFSFRVAAQLLQWCGNVSWLPDFESWHSASLPYEILLCAQVFILLALGVTLWRLAAGRMLPRAHLAQYWLTVGGLYFGSMLLRLSIGAVDLSAHRWFHSPLPCLFHLVLASQLLWVGVYHRRVLKATAPMPSQDANHV